MIEETILESNAILETIQEAIEEHRADAEDAVKEDAVKEANVLTAPVLTGSGLEPRGDDGDDIDGSCGG